MNFFGFSTVDNFITMKHSQHLMTEQDIILCVSGLGSTEDGLHTSNTIFNSLQITAPQLAARMHLREQVEFLELSSPSRMLRAESIAEGGTSSRYGDGARRATSTINITSDVTHEFSMSEWLGRSRSMDEVNVYNGTSF